MILINYFITEITYNSVFNNNKLYQYSDGQTKSYEFKPYELIFEKIKKKKNYYYASC